MKNSRFTVATHILSLLGFFQKADPEKLIKSHQIAESVNTNPVIIRRILALLRDAGLVQIQGGATGGAKLKRKADSITLMEVHKIIDEPEVFGLHTNSPSRKCPVGATIKPILTTVFHQVNEAIDGVLEQQTIGDLVSQMESRFQSEVELST